MATTFYPGQTDYIARLNELVDAVESGGTGGASEARYVSTITSVDASSYLSNCVVVASGRSAANDGGGGVFQYIKTSTATADGGIIFAPTSGTGRFFRDGYTVFGFNGSVQPEWWGADGSGDDTSPLQAMYNTINVYGGGSVLLNKQYTSGVLTVYSNTYTRGAFKDASAGFLVKAGTDNRIILCSGSTYNDIYFEDVTFDGNASNVSGTNPLITFYLATNFGFNNCKFTNVRRIAVNISSVVGYFHVTNCTFSSVGGNPDGSSGYRSQGIAISNATGTPSRWFDISNNIFEDIGLDAISLGFVKYGRVENNKGARTGAAIIYASSTAGNYNSHLSIKGNVGDGYYAALGISPEPNGIDLQYVTNSTVSGNVMNGFGGCGIGVFKFCDGIVLSDNICRDNGNANATWNAGIVAGSDSGDPVTNITIVNNICEDTRTTKTQSHGIQLGIDTLSSLILDSNQTDGNLNGAISYFYEATPGTHVTITDWSVIPEDWCVTTINGSSGVKSFRKPIGIAKYASSAALPAASGVGPGVAIATDSGTDYLWLSDGSTWVKVGSVPGASSVTITDSGAYYTSTHVEGALQEIGADIASLSAASGAQTDVANVFTKAQTSQLLNRGTVTGTVTLDASASNTQRLVLGGNITLAAPSNPMSGQNLGIHLIQDGTGSRLVTWNSAFLFPSGTDPVLSTAANARDFVACTYDDISGVWVCSLGVKGAA